MGVRITREEFLEKIFNREYQELKGKNLRLVRLNVKGKEVSLAQLIGVSDRRVYENLGLQIGVHAGEDHTGETEGFLISVKSQFCSPAIFKQKESLFRLGNDSLSFYCPIIERLVRAFLRNRAHPQQT